MAAIPPGTFQMGSVDGLGDLGEFPLHQVTIRGRFAVAKFELTFDEWDVCASYGDCDPGISANGWGRGRQPVINISWGDATSVPILKFLATHRRGSLDIERTLTEAFDRSQDVISRLGPA